MLACPAAAVADRGRSGLRQARVLAVCSLPVISRRNRGTGLRAEVLAHHLPEEARNLIQAGVLGIPHVLAIVMAGLPDPINSSVASSQPHEHPGFRNRVVSGRMMEILEQYLYAGTPPGNVGAAVNEHLRIYVTPGTGTRLSGSAPLAVPLHGGFERAVP